jgi:hypothetical protein
MKKKENNLTITQKLYINDSERAQLKANNW